MKVKTSIIYKAFFTLALLCCVQMSLGQVATNKYDFVNRATIISAKAYNDHGSDAGNSEKGSISNIYDGKSNWWESSVKGPVNVEFEFDKEVELASFELQEKGGKVELLESVVVSVPDREGWKDIQTFENSILKVSNNVVLNFDEPFKTKKLRIRFNAPDTDIAAVDEIYFYTTEEFSITHKRGKWFDIAEEHGLSDNVLGSFNLNDQWSKPDFPTSANKIQATHTYIETIYVHKGTKVSLSLPTQKSGSSSVQTYQRWYSYRTDGTFETNHQQCDGVSVYDLLTPSGNQNVYRLGNGYVGRPFGDIMQDVDFYYPTDKEFKTWFPNSNVDNDWFVVACDVSGYTDFTEKFISNGSVEKSLEECAEMFRETKYEPTLSVRVIFYIVGVDDNDSESLSYYRALTENNAYNSKGTGEKKYLEEYDITFPNKHLSNHTDELVALSKDARSYAIPTKNGYDGKDTNGLTVKIESKDPEGNTDILQIVGLTNSTISGENRIIKFRQSGVKDNTPWKVPDGTTATITVMKEYNGVTYNIARFNLTFTASSVPLTQHQVAAIKAGDPQEYRSPNWMNDNNNLKKLTELTFDDGYASHSQVNYGQEEYFHFPMAWDYCSYAFFDGSPRGDFRGLTPRDHEWYPEFDYYAIVSDYIGYGDVQDKVQDPPTNLAKDKGKYFVYVDASDRPGILARLPFEEKLCPGSELFVTAWVKSASQKGSDDAAMLFTVMGVEKNNDGSETYTPLYRHSTGQIRSTGNLPGTGADGLGDGTNDWFQIYFSFLNDKDASKYDHYVLQVENNCASTQGGDYYFDEIKVYIAQPNARVTQKEYTCTNTRTRMNIELDWERLMSRLGSEGVGEDGISFCFIDETAYNKYIKEHGSGDDTKTKAEAIRNSIVEIGDGEVINIRLMSIYFSNTFEDNDEIGHSSFPGNENETIPDGHYYFAYQHMKDGKPYFYRTGSETDPAGRRLTVDFYSVLSPNRPYRMLIVPVDPTLDDEALINLFANDIDDECGIYTDFYVTSEAMLKINGQIVDPEETYCVGQIFNFTVQVRVPKSKDANNEDGVDNDDWYVIDKGVYFDWFFGAEEEFTQAVVTQTDETISLDAALTDFRAIYPDATDINMTDTPPTEKYLEESDQPLTFTQDEYDLIYGYVHNEGETGGVNSRLVLHRDNLDIAMLSDGLQLVVKPIQMLMPPGDIDPDLWALVCWEYIPLRLNVSGDAPTLHAGFEEVKYPSDDFNPALRIGLAQIKKVSSRDDEDYLRIRLRGAKITNTGTADRLGEIESNGMNQLFLINSNDPKYSEKYFSGTDFNEFSLPIGTIAKLDAVPGNAEGGYMEVKFNLDKQEDNNDFQFIPREGYTYTCVAWFEEKNSNTGEVNASCYGSFPIEIKIVPEYLEWTGTENDNWNNDENWVRVSGEKLHFTDTEKAGKEDNLTDGKTNSNANGFVPMIFTNVVMPENSKARLYMAGYTEGGAVGASDVGHHWSSERPEDMGDPTENIQYDLMAYDGDPDKGTSSLTTQRYRVNICHDIHFMPGAQMLHAEQLIYTKAWTDVTVPTKKWTLISTPLKDVYAGDWYTTTSGTQADEVYFKDIKFDDNKNNRLNPAVYQRSWEKNATIVENPTTSTNVGFNTATPMWSAAYNDASVPYTAGGGFSIKAADAKGTGAEAGSLLFRLPKADIRYDYSTGEISRENSGKLFISGLINRDDPYNFKDNGEVTTKELTVSQDGKYMIVGNPYMAPLDLKAFFAANTNLTGKYWTETENGPGAGGSDSDGNNWLDPSTTSTIAPYGAFFVEKTDAAGENTVTFTAEMQKFDSEASTTNFTITAKNESGHSGAVLAYADNANNGYDEAEDVQLMRNLLGNNANELSVYTVAGDMAMSINRIKDLQQIPLGVFAADGDVTTVTFTGVAALMEPSLYDAAMNTDTPLTEGYTLTVDGASHGRYFIRAKGAGSGNDGTTGITDVEAGGNDVTVYSVVQRQVVVSSSAELLDVTVYSVGGSMLKHESVGGGRTAITLDGVDSGVAVVRVVTTEGTVTKKVLIQ